MTTKTAIAKPYAKAIFSLALAGNQLISWQDTLERLAQAVIEGEKYHLFDNPKITLATKLEIFAAITGQNEALNLLKLLLEHKRLAWLPAITAGYKQMVLAHNNQLEVQVIAAYELTEEQKQSLLATLKKCYHQEVMLQCYIDTTLIGGAVLYIADKVIDGSIKGVLQRLRLNLLRSTC